MEYLIVACAVLAGAVIALLVIVNGLDKRLTKIEKKYETTD